MIKSKLKAKNRPFPHCTLVRTNNSTSARLGWAFSYIYCIIVHPDLDLALLFVGMRERSVATVNRCFDLARSRQHGEAAKNRTTGLWTDYLQNARGNDLRLNSDTNVCGLVNVTCKTSDPEQ